MRTTKFEVLQNAAGRWFWHERAGNNEIVAVSQPYTRKSSAVRRARKQSARVPGSIVTIG